MRQWILGVVAGLAVVPTATAENAATEAALTPMAETFARGFYARNPEMVLSVVHPELSKIGVIPNAFRSGRDITEELPPGTLEVLGVVYNYDNRLSVEHSTVGVDFFDSVENVGVFQLTADTDWYDIFLGTRINGEWVLVNCAYGAYDLIENPNRDADMASVAEVVRTYAEGWDQRDYDAVRSTIYPNADRRHVVRDEPREYLYQETLETIQHELAAGEAAMQASEVTVFEATQRTAAARIDAADRTEWVLLQRLNDRWQIVNMFWEARG